MALGSQVPSRSATGRLRRPRPPQRTREERGEAGKWLAPFQGARERRGSRLSSHAGVGRCGAASVARSRGAACQAAKPPMGGRGYGPHPLPRVPRSLLPANEWRTETRGRRGPVCCCRSHDSLLSVWGTQEASAVTSVMPVFPYRCDLSHTHIAATRSSLRSRCHLDSDPNGHHSQGWKSTSERGRLVPSDAAVEVKETCETCVTGSYSLPPWHSPSRSLFGV